MHESRTFTHIDIYTDIHGVYVVVNRFTQFMRCGVSFEVYPV